MPERAYVGTELELFAHAEHWKAYLISAMQGRVRGDVAEVGAGLGVYTKLFLSKLETRSWSCIEPDKALMSKLREQLAPNIESGDVRCIAGTLDDVDPSARFDCILYIDVLEHIEDDRAELRRAADHLAQAGHLLVLSPAHDFLFSDFDRAIGHHRRYDTRSLNSVAPPELEQVSMLYLDSVGMLASLVNRWILKQSQPTRTQIQLWDRRMVPLSRLIDPWLGYRLGKSILGVWRKP
ncbi:MAG TPA: class I SAM-dependent methyltransferase [Polyangiales bacterium]|nr:class I SAM-dependent methyltransferase [Polyangiales bacterium]